MDAKIIRPVQLIYFNKNAWYGVSLIANILGDVAKLTASKSSTSVRGDPVVLFSFLAAREFQYLFDGFDRIGLPYLSRARGPGHPLVIAGGGAMMNPEPIAEFVDIVCIGEGELWAETIRDLLIAGRDREYILSVLAELPGAYIPNRRSIEYDESGIMIRSVTGETDRIPPAVTAEIPLPDSGLGGFRQLELARSCASKCTFCSIGWGMEYREQPKEKIIAALSQPHKPSLWASNMGGVSYLQEIRGLMGTSSLGEDTRIDDFLRYPEPAPGEYSKNRFTFGLEGQNERLRAILGKYIKDSDVAKTIDRLAAGNAQKAQFYYIRGVPTESESDWRAFRKWIDHVLDRFDPLKIAVEFMLTPLTRTPHTPLQWVENRYNFDSEAETLELLDYARRRKKAKPESMLYITPFRRGPAWLLDTAYQCGSRRLGKFLFAVHSGKIGNLDADSFDGRGFDLVRRVLRASGTDPDALTAAWDTAAVLPWSFITPFGERGDRARIAAYKKVMKLIDASRTGGTYNPTARAVQYHNAESAE